MSGGDIVRSRTSILVIVLTMQGSVGKNWGGGSTMGKTTIRSSYKYTPRCVGGDLRGGQSDRAHRCRSDYAEGRRDGESKNGAGREEKWACDLQKAPRMSFLENNMSWPAFRA